MTSATDTSLSRSNAAYNCLFGGRARTNGLCSPPLFRFFFVPPDGSRRRFLPRLLAPATTAGKLSAARSGERLPTWPYGDGRSAAAIPGFYRSATVCVTRCSSAKNPHSVCICQIYGRDRLLPTVLSGRPVRRSTAQLSTQVAVFLRAANAGCPPTSATNEQT